MSIRRIHTNRIIFSSFTSSSTSNAVSTQSPNSKASHCGCDVKCDVSKERIYDFFPVEDLRKRKKRCRALANVDCLLNRLFVRWLVKSIVLFATWLSPAIRCILCVSLSLFIGSYCRRLPLQIAIRNKINGFCSEETNYKQQTKDAARRLPPPNRFQSVELFCRVTNFVGMNSNKWSAVAVAVAATFGWFSVNGRVLFIVAAVYVLHKIHFCIHWTRVMRCECHYGMAKRTTTTTTTVTCFDTCRCCPNETNFVKNYYYY